MSDGTLEPAESQASQSGSRGRPTIFHQNASNTCGSKTVRLLRPTTTTVIEEGYTIELRFFFVVVLTFLFSPNLCRSMLFRT